MHNRKKVAVRPPNEAEMALQKKKRDVLLGSFRKILLQKQTFQNTTVEDGSLADAMESMELTAKLIKMNPDFYSLWNYRREIITCKLESGSSSSSSSSGEQRDAIRDEELSLSADGIRRNPKSYGAWHHRVWVLEKFQVDIESELSLCKDLLKLDQRNFHCWNYRRHLINKAHDDKSFQEEMTFSTEKINENFSNYSAFHHRSVFISDTLRDQGMQYALEPELQIIESAIFTEPDDQSAWWYQNFLMTWASGNIKKKAGTDDCVKLMDWFYGVLQKQLEMVQSLLEVETGSKWAMNSQVMILDLLLADNSSLCRTHLAAARLVSATDGGKAYESVDSDVSTLQIDWARQKRCLLENLIVVDPMHCRRYKYLLRKF